MPSASAQMIVALAKDAKAIDAALEKMQAHVKKIGEPASMPIIEKLQGQFDKFKPAVDRFVRELALKPPIFADETDYKASRKLITGLMGLVEKTTKMVAKEQADAKNEVTIDAVTAAESELVGTDKKLAQALKAVARGDKGRAGPKEKGIDEYNHIHIGGNAKSNLLFQPGKKLVLGILSFHLDSGNNDQEKAKIKKVAGRGGGKITLVINGDDISVKK
jgi:hypothetical protein